MARVTIFHTSDMHNKLNAALAGKLRDLKAAHPGSLMLDSGDAIWAGNVFWRPGGEPVLDLMNSVPYDALCVGNREFHFLGIGMECKTSRARFPVLSANLRSAKGTLTPNPAPYKGEGGAGANAARSLAPSGGEGWGEGACARIRTHISFRIADLQVTVVGLSVPCVTERMLVRKLSDYYFEQPTAAAAQVVPRLRKECDLLVALTHIGIKADRELAEHASGIDVILGGHTHTITQQPERVGDTWIAHHGFYAHYVGKVAIDVEPGRVTVADELIPLGKG